MSERAFKEVPDLMNSYYIKVYCYNCGWHGNLRFKKGEPVKTNMVGEVSDRHCQNCGCPTLHKSP